MHVISKDPSGSRYKLWQFNCRTVDRGESDHRRSGGETAKEIWTVMSVESYDPVKIKKLLAQEQRVMKSHLHSGSLQNVLSTHWLLSKKGEVNLTEFKQDKKAAIARFLAKSVEGEEVGETP